MASLLPVIPTEWRAKKPSHEIVRFCTDCPGDRGRWGADEREYGGVGGAADHVIRQGGVTSRSHWYYGAGIINCFAQRQPYQITNLLLSDSRPYDQLLPPPLLTNKIVRHRQLCGYPGNHAYTSHRSQFAVFPLADKPFSMASSRLSPLSRGTSDILRQMNHRQFCSTTYQDAFTNPWTHREEKLPPPPTGTAGANTSIGEAEDKQSDDNKEEKCKDRCENRRKKDKVELCELQPGEAARDGEEDLTSSDGGERGTQPVKKRVHWLDQEGEAEGEREAESQSESESGREDENAVATEKESEKKEECEEERLRELVLLHVSGSKIPQKLGVRFKTHAHSRYHQLYPDKIPDLRESRVESKKYFFFGVHSSVLR